MFRQAEESKATTGIEYIVPILAGLGREGVMAELPALLQVSVDLSKVLEQFKCQFCFHGAIHDYVGSSISPLKCNRGGGLRKLVDVYRRYAGVVEQMKCFLLTPRIVSSHKICR